MDDLIAQLLLPDGPARISATGGTYDLDEEVVEVDEAVRLVAADGYTMTASGVSVDLDARTMQGHEGVEGAVPAGTFSARAIRADLSARTLSLEGNARLSMIPGELRVP